MVTSQIAWDYLEPIERAQLLHFSPYLRQSECKHCGGNLMTNYDETFCLQCGRPHTERGELIPTLKGGK